MCLKSFPAYIHWNREEKKVHFVVSLITINRQQLKPANNFHNITSFPSTSTYWFQLWFCASRLHVFIYISLWLSHYTATTSLYFSIVFSFSKRWKLKLSTTASTTRFKCCFFFECNVIFAFECVCPVCSRISYEHNSCEHKLSTHKMASNGFLISRGVGLIWPENDEKPLKL